MGQGTSKWQTQRHRQQTGERRADGDQPAARRAGTREDGARLRISEANIDWYSRRVLGWCISNSMETAFCVDCLEEALLHHGRPEVFNSDQGAQFTSEDLTGVLQREGVAISMDGRGRAFDNIFVERLWRSITEHEDVYLKGYSTG